MSLEAILAKIASDAEQEAGEILRSASDEREEALRRAGSRLEEQQGRDLKKLELEMDDLRNRLEDHARRQTRRKLQNRRRQLIDEAIESAVSKLAAESDQRYLELVRRIIDGCGAEGNIEVMISPDDAGRVTQAFLDTCSDKRRKFLLSEDRHSGVGGVVLVSDRISYNGTFSMIAELAHEELVMKLSSIAPLE